MEHENHYEKMLAEKEAEIQRLRSEVQELKSKLLACEMKMVYHGIIPDDVIEELVKLPPEKIVIEVGRYLRELLGNLEIREDDTLEISLERVSRIKEELEGESGDRVKATVIVDPEFCEEYDYDGCDSVLLSQDIMSVLGVVEDDYVLIKKNGYVRMRVLPYPGSRVVVLPTWAREKIGVKVNEEVEIIKKKREQE